MEAENSSSDIPGSPPQDHTAAGFHYDFLYYATFPVSALILCANIPVILAILRNRKLHSPTFTFIFCLSVADLWVGVVSLGRAILQQGGGGGGGGVGGGGGGYISCLVRVALLMAPVCASLCFMFWIGADRLTAIHSPLKYEQQMTRCRCAAATSLTWVYALMVGVSPLLSGFDDGSSSSRRVRRHCSFILVVHTRFIWVAAISFLLPLVGVLLVYAKIFSVARTQLKKINTIESSLGTHYNQLNHEEIRPRSMSFPSTGVLGSGKLARSGRGSLKHGQGGGKRTRTQSLNITGQSAAIPEVTEVSSGYVTGATEVTSGFYIGETEVKSSSVTRVTEVAEVSTVTEVSVNPADQFSAVNREKPRDSVVNVRDEVRKNHIKRTLKAVRTLLVILGCFLATWGPFITCTIIQQLCYSCRLHDVIGTYLLLLGLCNSFLNPLVYAYWNKDFRNILRQTLHVRKCCRNNHNNQRFDAYGFYP